MGMRIAILGSGMAGLSLALLCQTRHCATHPISVTLFDPLGIRGGASFASTGLLHPFPGPLALSSWHSVEGMQATCSLLKEAEAALGRPVSDTSGLVRLATQTNQPQNFAKRALEDPRALFWDAGRVHSLFPHAITAPALFIPEARAVYSRLYLKGLKAACHIRGVQFIQEKVNTWEELSAYDRIILTLGAGILDFPLPKQLPLKRTKGHALFCRIQEPLPCSLAADGHISKTEDPLLVQIGSTYEHNFSSIHPDPTKIWELKEKAALFYPPARDFQAVELTAGIRIAPSKGYRPIIEQIDTRRWIFTGLSSRGLLYHAYLSAQLAEKITQPEVE